MKIYLLLLGAGILVGVIYGLINVHSLTPPVVALIGLLGILVGEQIVPVAQRVISGQGLSIDWLQRECGEHVFGTLPSRETTTNATRKETPS